MHPLEDTIAGFEAILNGEADELPESAFMYVGSLDEAMDKAKGRVHRGRQAIRNEVAELLAPREVELTDMREHNTTLIDEAEPLGNRIVEAEEKAERKVKQAVRVEHEIAKAAKAIGGEYIKQTESTSDDDNFTSDEIANYLRD